MNEHASNLCDSGEGFLQASTFTHLSHNLLAELGHHEALSFVESHFYDTKSYSTTHYIIPILVFSHKITETGKY